MLRNDLLIIMEFEQNIIQVKIVSGSMEPLIKTGEVINVRKLQRGEQLTPLKCYVFRAIDQEFTCHYFLKDSKLEPGKLIFRSLASGEIDAPVSKNEVFGVAVNKKVGAWLIFKLWLKKFFFK